MINKKNGLLFLLGCLVGICVNVGELYIKSISSLDYRGDGCIDTPQLAACIGIAYLCDIYGDEQIKGELPFDVIEFQKSWLVEGNLPKGHYGGVASINIRKKDGMVIRYAHDE